MKPCSVLVIDDESALREILSQVLTDAGHRVVGAENGKEASKALAKAAFDVVLTDMLMPERDGIEVIGELRRMQPEARIVAMSGGGRGSRDHYLQTAKGLGAHAVLGKPFSMSELTAALDSVLIKP